MLKAYSLLERKRAKNLQAKISKETDPGDDILVNHIYVSAAFPSDKSFAASENPG